MMSFWVTFVAFLVLISSFFVGDGPTLGGWTQYAPLNAVGAVAGPGQGLGVVLWAASIAIFCVGQLLGSLNFITTTLDLRVKGMSLMRLPAHRVGMVHHVLHGPHGVCGINARLHPGDSGPRGRHQLLRPIESGHQ